MSYRPNYFAKKFPRVTGVLGWGIFVVFTIVTAVVVGISAVDLLSPGSNGPAGTVVITRCDDSARDRPCFGDFTSNDGKVTIANSDVTGEGAAQPGQRFSGFGDVSEKLVTIPSGWQRFADLVFSVPLLVGWLIAFRYRIYVPLRRRRKARQVAAR